jgi:DNA-binding XRE family transcriptional regulator
MAYTLLKTPGGEELVVMPRADYETLRDEVDAAAHARTVAEIEAGRQEWLSEEEVLSSLAEPTALAFWRKKRGMTQKQLGERVGVSQQFLAQLEKAQRKGDPQLFLSLSRALRVRMEDLVEG